jgi:hypothetical protein
LPSNPQRNSSQFGVKITPSMKNTNNSELGLVRLVDHDLLPNSVAADSLTILRPGKTELRESHDLGLASTNCCR